MVKMELFLLKNKDTVITINNNFIKINRKDIDQTLIMMDIMDKIILNKHLNIISNLIIKFLIFSKINNLLIINLLINLINSKDLQTIIKIFKTYLHQVRNTTTIVKHLIFTHNLREYHHINNSSKG